MRERRRVLVQGIVQGVGFRPFVYGLARRHALAGCVHNDAAGVTIEIEGEPDRLDRFLCAVRDEAPPLALVERVVWEPLPVAGTAAAAGFVIEVSPGAAAAQKQALIAPDVGVCADCQRELFDPGDRRYRYPFINCTNCGPRFTIIRDVPYDRERTTMTAFPMCPACQHEYDDPANRRFHAQPNACPVCGPRVRLVDRTGVTLAAAEAAIPAAAARLREGAIVAVKGLGGYHLACDPFQSEAVGALRGRKVRQDKPFALMALDLEAVRALCRTTPDEEALLACPGRPIVLLERREEIRIAANVAPRQRTLGVMLAYTPLHLLLLSDAGIPLVMTSGNRSDEPIAYRDDDARAHLGEIADCFLVHDRPIHMRCDDTVTRVIGGVACPLRRSRGAAPAPLGLAEEVTRPILACGAALKNTFCLARGRHAFLSHHIGDLENYETARSFQEGIEHYCRLFDVRPERIACDLHPEYLSTRYAREREEDTGLPAVAVQHHHAHIASCLADNERPIAERVIGVALDGTGYGPDGAVWGGEFLEGSIAQGFARRGHLEYLPLPGGEAAIRQPWRMAAAQLISLYGEERAVALPLALVRRAGEADVRRIARLLEHRLNTPLTSSAGRLFDAVAALVGVPGSQRTTYEGQAAVELELAACNAAPSSPPHCSYPFRLRPDAASDESGWVVETRALLAAVTDDVLAARPAGEIAARFHQTMAQSVAAGCARIRETSGVNAVALSGGTFQNRLLLEQTLDLLTRDGFTVYRHRRVPANDGGLSLGQAVLADRVFARQEAPKAHGAQRAREA